MGAAPSPAARNTSTHLIGAIVDHLHERRFRPGDRLPSERLLAATLGVGRNAVREALAVMASLRMVEIRPNSGVYLGEISSDGSFEELVLMSDMGRPPRMDEVIDAMEVRVPLELTVVQLACERRTDADLDHLNALLARESAAVRQGENTAVHDHNFHLALADSAHNNVLRRLLNSFYRLSLPRRQPFFGDPRRARESAAEHRKLVALIAARDAEGASTHMMAHMRRARLYWAAELAPPAG